MSAPQKLRPAPVAAVAETAKPIRKTVDIGCRYTPAYALRMDRSAGTYEEVNSQVLSQTEDYVQRALLAPVRDPASLQRIEAARVARRVTNGAPQQ